jgi:hypothetical protein
MLMVFRLPFAPRAFLQIFITTTLHHRLAGFQSLLALLVRRYCSTSYAIDSGHPSNDNPKHGLVNPSKEQCDESDPSR